MIKELLSRLDTSHIGSKILNNTLLTYKFKKCELPIPINMGNVLSYNYDFDSRATINIEIKNGKLYHTISNFIADDTTIIDSEEEVSQYIASAKALTINAMFYDYWTNKYNISERFIIEPNHKFEQYMYFPNNRNLTILFSKINKFNNEYFRTLEEFYQDENNKDHICVYYDTSNQTGVYMDKTGKRRKLGMIINIEYQSNRDDVIDLLYHVESFKDQEYIPYCISWLDKSRQKSARF